MKRIAHKAAAPALLALGLAACGSDAPEWIREPATDGGLAATACVKDSGNLAVDRQVIIAQARGEIARQLQERVIEMDDAYDDLAEPVEGKPDTTFASVAKQIAEPMLASLAPTRVEYLDFDDERRLCTHVGMDRAQARVLYDKLVEASGRKIDPAQAEALYLEFAGEPPAK
jgi:hypothetical protein